MKLINTEVFLWLKCYILRDLIKYILDIIAQLYLQDADNIDQYIIKIYDDHLKDCEFLLIKPNNMEIYEEYTYLVSKYASNNYITRIKYSRIDDSQIIYVITLVHDITSSNHFTRKAGCTKDLDIDVKIQEYTLRIMNIMLYLHHDFNRKY